MARCLTFFLWEMRRSVCQAAGSLSLGQEYASIRTTVDSGMVDPAETVHMASAYVVFVSIYLFIRKYLYSFITAYIRYVPHWAHDSAWILLAKFGLGSDCF